MHLDMANRQAMKVTRNQWSLSLVVLFHNSFSNLVCVYNCIVIVPMKKSLGQLIDTINIILFELLDSWKHKDTFINLLSLRFAAKYIVFITFQCDIYKSINLTEIVQMYWNITKHLEML